MIPTELNFHKSSLGKIVTCEDGKRRKVRSLQHALDSCYFIVNYKAHISVYSLACQLLDGHVPTNKDIKQFNKEMNAMIEKERKKGPLFLTN